MKSIKLLYFALCVLMGFVQAQSSTNPMIKAVSQFPQASKSFDQSVDGRDLDKQVEGMDRKAESAKKQNEFSKLYVNLSLGSFLAHFSLGQDIEIKFKPPTKFNRMITANSKFSFLKKDNPSQLNTISIDRRSHLEPEKCLAEPGACYDKVALMLGSHVRWLLMSVFVESVKNLNDENDIMQEESVAKAGPLDGLYEVIDYIVVEK